MLKIVMLETKWYLTAQDGREGPGYDTEEEAKQALKALPKVTRRGYHITSLTKTVSE